jgi:hypothetical protein
MLLRERERVFVFLRVFLIEKDSQSDVITIVITKKNPT